MASHKRTNELNSSISRYSSKHTKGKSNENILEHHMKSLEKVNKKYLELKHKRLFSATSDNNYCFTLPESLVLFDSNENDLSKNLGFNFHRNGERKEVQKQKRTIIDQYKSEDPVQPLHLYPYLITNNEVDAEKVACLHLLSTRILRIPVRSFHNPEKLVWKKLLPEECCFPSLPFYCILPAKSSADKHKEVVEIQLINLQVERLISSVLNSLRSVNQKKIEEVSKFVSNEQQITHLFQSIKLSNIFDRNDNIIPLLASLQNYRLIDKTTENIIPIHTLRLPQYCGLFNNVVSQLDKEIFRVAHMLTKTEYEKKPFSDLLEPEYVVEFDKTNSAKYVKIPNNTDVQNERNSFCTLYKWKIINEYAPLPNSQRTSFLDDKSNIQNVMKKLDNGQRIRLGCEVAGVKSKDHNKKLDNVAIGKAIQKVLSVNSLISLISKSNTSAEECDTIMKPNDKGGLELSSVINNRARKDSGQRQSKDSSLLSIASKQESQVETDLHTISEIIENDIRGKETDSKVKKFSLSVKDRLL